VQDVFVSVEIDFHFEMNGVDQQISFNKSKSLILGHKVKWG
jgi:hypothetical protein